MAVAGDGGGESDDGVGGDDGGGSGDDCGGCSGGSDGIDDGGGGSGVDDDGERRGRGAWWWDAIVADVAAGSRKGCAGVLPLLRWRLHLQFASPPFWTVL